MLGRSVAVEVECTVRRSLCSHRRGRGRDAHQSRGYGGRRRVDDGLGGPLHSRGAWSYPPCRSSLSHDSNLFVVPAAPGDTLAHVRPSFEGAYESPHQGISRLRRVRGSAVCRVSGPEHARCTAELLSSTRESVHRLVDVPRSRRSLQSNGFARRTQSRERDSARPRESRRVQVTPSASYRLSSRTDADGAIRRDERVARGRPGQTLHAARVGMDYGWSARTQWGGRYLARSFVASPLDPEYSHTLLASWTRQLRRAPTRPYKAVRESFVGGVRPEFLASFLHRKPRQRFLSTTGMARQSCSASRAGRNPQRLDQTCVAPAPPFRGRHESAVFRSHTLDHLRRRVPRRRRRRLDGPRAVHVDRGYGTDVQRGDIRSRGRPMSTSPRRLPGGPDRRTAPQTRLQTTHSAIRLSRSRECNRHETLLAIASVCLCVAARLGAGGARHDPAPPERLPGTAPRPPIRVADDGGYKIGPEDVLDISVWKNPELSRTVPVRPDGKVSLPLVNDIQAAGLTPTACARS